MSADGSAAGAGAALVLLTVAAGGFLMTLDTSVMNVAIATAADDVRTDVTGIQTAITLSTLVMATLMITAGKVGALIGRKRALGPGCVIYGVGSLTTAIAPSLPVLLRAGRCGGRRAFRQSSRSWQRPSAPRDGRVPTAW